MREILCMACAEGNHDLHIEGNNVPDVPDGDEGWTCPCTGDCGEPSDG